MSREDSERIDAIIQFVKELDFAHKYMGVHFAMRKAIDSEESQQIMPLEQQAELADAFLNEYMKINSVDENYLLSGLVRVVELLWTGIENQVNAQEYNSDDCQGETRLLDFVEFTVDKLRAEL